MNAANGKGRCASIRTGPDFKQEPIWPANVTRCHSAGILFTWRQAEHDLVTVCPICAGRLVLHESRPWFWCHGEMRCTARSMSFAELVDALAQKVEAK